MENLIQTIAFKESNSKDAPARTFEFDLTKLTNERLEALIWEGLKRKISVATNESTTRLADIGKMRDALAAGDWPKVFASKRGLGTKVGDPVQAEMVNLALAYVKDRTGAPTLIALHAHATGRKYVNQTSTAFAMNVGALLEMAERFDATLIEKGKPEAETFRARAAAIVAARTIADESGTDDEEAFAL